MKKNKILEIADKTNVKTIKVLKNTAVAINIKSDRAGVQGLHKALLYRPYTLMRRLGVK